MSNWVTDWHFILYVNKSDLLYYEYKKVKSFLVSVLHVDAVIFYIVVFVGLGSAHDNVKQHATYKHLHILPSYNQFHAPPPHLCTNATSFSADTDVTTL